MKIKRGWSGVDGNHSDSLCGCYCSRSSLHHPSHHHGEVEQNLTFLQRKGNYMHPSVLTKSNFTDV